MTLEGFSKLDNFGILGFQHHPAAETQPVLAFGLELGWSSRKSRVAEALQE